MRTVIGAILTGIIGLSIVAVFLGLLYLIGSILGF